MTRPTLTWKHEDGEGPQAVGPAWIDDADGSRRVRDGDWITKAEARRIARAEGFALQFDEAPAADSQPELAEAAKGRVRDLAARVAALGCTAADLSFEPTASGKVCASGARLVEFGFARPQREGSPFRTGDVVIAIEDAEAIMAAFPS